MGRAHLVFTVKRNSMTTSVVIQSAGKIPCYGVRTYYTNGQLTSIVPGSKSSIKDRAEMPFMGCLQLVTLRLH